MFFHPSWLIQIYWTHASHYQENPMFRWAIIFAIIAIIASFLGFGNIAGLSKEFAYIFLIIAVVLFVIGFVGGRRR